MSAIGKMSAISANPGSADEIAVAVAPAPGWYYIVVVGNNGAHAPNRSYGLRATAYSFQDFPPCTATFPYQVAVPTSFYQPSWLSNDQIDTLILFNKRRMDYTYGYTDTNALSNTLKLLADDSTVNGVIYAVDNIVSMQYNQWDADACNPYAANKVAQAIYDYIISPAVNYTYTNTKYIIIVGDDSIIPFYRVADLSAYANERQYLPSARLKNYNSTWSALGWGYLLTDNYYGDVDSRKYWHGHYLSIPDLAVGRLVEAPADIQAAVNQYLSQGWMGLSPSHSMVSGYDFLSDSATATSQWMEYVGLTDSPLINDTWDADQLRTLWLDGTDKQQLVSLNAHFEHHAAIPADESGGPVKSNELGNYTHNPAFTVQWSVGCHSGYSVPDAHSADATTALDFAQAFGLYPTNAFIGNTGYGLGDTTEIGYSEKLLYYFAQELGSRANMPVGEALLNAKQRYVSSAPSGGFSIYDEKVMIESTLYGLPMYHVSVPDPKPVGGPFAQSMVQSAGVTASGVSTTDIHFSFYFEPHDIGWGTYFTEKSYGTAQTSTGRPIQPLVIEELTPPQPGMAAHGVVIISTQAITYTSFDPVIAAVVTDTSGTEPDFDYAGWYPINIIAINRLGDTDTLVIVPGQYHATQELEKLYTELTVRVYYTDSADYTPPSIWDTEIAIANNAAHVSVKASDDESGIDSVWCTYRLDDGVWHTVEMNQDSSDTWVYDIDTGGSDQVQYIIQAVDQSGNVSYSNNKGLFFEPQETNIYLPVVIRNAPY